MLKKCKWILILIILLSCITSAVVIANEVGTYDDLSVDYLKENSEFCMLVITMEETEFPETDMLIAINPFFDPKDKVIVKDGNYYLTLYVNGVYNPEQKDGNSITIVQQNEQIITETGFYIVFLNKSSIAEDCYELSCGYSSVISVKESKLVPLDKRLKKSVENDIGENLSDFDKWLEENYY